MSVSTDGQADPQVAITYGLNTELLYTQVCVVGPEVKEQQQRLMGNKK